MISSRIFESEARRFLLVGSMTVAIDFSVYFFLLIIAGFDTGVSKGIGFSSGTFFAYFANRNFTFNSPVKGFFIFSLFWALYITTLTINIGTNELGLLILGESDVGILLSLFIATGLSALLNYIGMKFIVFRY
jgi:putative flippase GtrA